MTKYEWETELKKNIHRLPADEINRVMEYYAELFEDYIERGKTETQIINEFGNPVDVADKILSEYDGELADGVIETRSTPASAPTSEPARDEIAPPEKPDDAATAAHKIIEIVNEPVPEEKMADGDKNTAEPSVPARKNSYSVLKIVGLVLLGILCVGVVASGAYVVIVSFGVMAQSIGSGLVHLGIGVAVIGLGVLIGLPIYNACEKSKHGKTTAATHAAKGENGHEDEN